MMLSSNIHESSWLKHVILLFSLSLVFRTLNFFYMIYLLLKIYMNVLNLPLDSLFYLNEDLYSL